MIILESIVGSTLHGLNTPDSDVDKKQVICSPLIELLSPFHKDKGKEQGDTTVYEARHFAKLLSQGNPTALEVLWSTMWEKGTHEIAKWWIYRKAFLDSERIYRAHLGYAQGQRLKVDKADDRRRGKLAVALLRVLIQGEELLRTGDFTTNMRMCGYFDLMMELKTRGCSYEQYTDEVALAAYDLETELTLTYINHKDQFKLDVDKIEHLVYDTYLWAERARQEQGGTL